MLTWCKGHSVIKYRKQKKNCFVCFTVASVSSWRALVKFVERKERKKDCYLDAQSIMGIHLRECYLKSIKEVFVNESRVLINKESQLHKWWPKSLAWVTHVVFRFRKLYLSFKWSICLSLPKYPHFSLNVLCQNKDSYRVSLHSPDILYM